MTRQGPEMQISSSLSVAISQVQVPTCTYPEPRGRSRSGQGHKIVGLWVAAEAKGGTLTLSSRHPDGAQAF